MSARFLLIDGYNLMHAAGMARLHYGPGDLQRCRERLLRHLASHLSPAEIARTLVVFDAREPPPDRPSELTLNGIRVLFANPGGDADVALQESLAEHSTPRRVTLVSSDHVLQQAARLHGAESVGSEKFIARLNERRRGKTHQGTPDDKPADRLSPAEAEHWLKCFGDLSEVLAAESRTAEDARPQDPPGNEAPGGGKTREESRPAHQPQRRPRRSSKSPRKKEDPKDVGDLDFWMHVFRGLPEAAELAKGLSSSTDSDSGLEAWLDQLGDDRPQKRTD